MLINVLSCLFSLSSFICSVLGLTKKRTRSDKPDEDAEEQDKKFGDIKYKCWNFKSIRTNFDNMKAHFEFWLDFLETRRCKNAILRDWEITEKKSVFNFISRESWVFPFQMKVLTRARVLPIIFYRPELPSSKIYFKTFRIFSFTTFS